MSKLVDSIIQDVISSCPDDEVLKDVIAGLRETL
jgi:hypothetical protein